MEDTARNPVVISYRRGSNLLLPAGLLLTSALLFGGLIITAFLILPASDRQVAWLLSAVLLAGWAIVAAVSLPPIRRFGGAAPAIVISPDGVRTRDMSAALPWHDIERLSVHDVVSNAGAFSTVTTAFEIHPLETSAEAASRLRLLDGHAHPYKVALHVLENPHLLAAALASHAPHQLLARSDLAALPASERLLETSGEPG